jgi:hypothetical protein
MEFSYTCQRKFATDLQVDFRIDCSKRLGSDVLCTSFCAFVRLWPILG